MKLFTYQLDSMFSIFKEEMKKDMNNQIKPEHFVLPDGENDWPIGSETFTRKEVFALIWTQRAMFCNDIRRNCELTPELLFILDNPRIPKF